MSEVMQKEFNLTIKQVAIQCQVTERTVHRWMADGLLPAQHLGVRCVRISQDDVNKLFTPIEPCIQ